MKNIRYIKKCQVVKILMCLCIILPFAGCNSDDDIKGEDPYGGGKEPYGIRLLTDLPTPESAYPGERVTYKAIGLSKWFDDNEKPRFDFFISDQKAEILAATDTTITVKVPESLSTGISHILLNDQIFYGPKLTVLGNVRTDVGYSVNKPIPGAIYDYLESFDTKKKDHYYWVGTFQNGNNNNFTQAKGIVWIDPKGTVVRSWNSDYQIDGGQGFDLDKDNPNSLDGGNAYLKSITYFNNDKTGNNPNMLISGKFTKYHPVSRYPMIPVANIIKLSYNLGALYDEVKVPNSKTGILETLRVPKFNGGTKEEPVETFITSGDQVIAVGNITQYCRLDADRSYSDNLSYEYQTVRNVVRMNNVGELDADYRKDKPGAAGVIRDAYMDEEEGVVICGDIATFDGVSVPNLLRLDQNGNIDEQFMRNIGTGANGTITRMRYNKKRGKVMLVGTFSEFNGQSVPGMVMLNPDGTIDPEFKPRKMEGGLPNFACVLNDHDIVVVSGTFNKYDGITRHGFLLLNLDGDAMQKFNVPGLFTGELYQVIETKTSSNDNGLLLLGEFNRFNGEIAYNALKIEIDID